MIGYIIRRIILVIPTLLLVTILVFITIRLIPGTAIDQMLAQYGAQIGGAVQKELTVKAIEQKLGLDVPIHIQYGRWLGAAFQGDLGKSLWTDIAVTDEIFQKLPVSIELGLLGIIVALLIAFPVGIYSAMRQDTVGDYLARTLAIACIAIPGFWVGTMVMVYPSIWWNWTPGIEFVPFLEDPLANLGQFIIPACILGMLMSGTTMRMTRTMMLEVLRQDYIRTAWAKGLREKIVIMRHALKNAVIPVVTIVGMQVPIMVGGSVVLERIFVLPGVGNLLLDSISQRDYTVLSGVNLFVAASVLVMNLAVDLTYGYLDPRIKYR
jgi:peptide/nickel transport system permease protein